MGNCLFWTWIISLFVSIGLYVGLTSTETEKKLGLAGIILLSIAGFFGFLCYSGKSNSSNGQSGRSGTGNMPNPPLPVHHHHRRHHHHRNNDPFDVILEG